MRSDRPSFGHSVSVRRIFWNPLFAISYPGIRRLSSCIPLAEVMPKGEVDVSRLLEKFSKSEAEAKERQGGAKPARGSKFTILSRERIVDLHIEELIKDPTGMSNAQIISYQLNHFQRNLTVLCWINCTRSRSFTVWEAAYCAVLSGKN